MRIKIGPLVYLVKRRANLTNADGQKLMGRVQPSEAVIEIENAQKTEVSVTVLWHEILHAILIQTGHAEHDEDLIIALEHGIPQVIAENPELVEMTLTNKWPIK